MLRSTVRILLVASAAAMLAACQDDFRASGSRHWVSMSPEIVALMAAKGMNKSDPVLIRSYKQEAEFEVWKKGRDGRYALLKTFPICRWSGQLGPKVREGDRQAPEGYYPITPAQMNPNSNFYLSFDTGFPNAFDRQHGRSGSFLMVHGACSSRGCFSMTDEQIRDIYALVRDAQAGGQRAVQMQSFPFRMTAQNLAKHRFNPNIAFWKNLKEGSDYFEVTGQEPRVAANGGRYVFNAEDPPAGEVRLAVQRKQAEDNARVAELVREGTPAVKIVYADGGQHPSFGGTALAYAGGAGTESLMSGATGPGSKAVAEMSRPEAIGAEQVIAVGADGKPLKQPAKPAVTLVAAAEPAKPEAAPPQTTRIAQASIAATATTPAAKPAEEKSMMSRMFGAIGGAIGFGGSAAAQPQEEVLPLPPRRAALARGRAGETVALRTQ